MILCVYYLVVFHHGPFTLYFTPFVFLVVLLVLSRVRSPEHVRMIRSPVERHIRDCVCRVLPELSHCRNNRHTGWRQHKSRSTGKSIAYDEINESY